MSQEEGVPFDTDFMESGWMRWLPHGALMIHMAVLDASLRDVAGDLEALQDDERFRMVTRGLESAVWDEPEDLDPDDPEDAEELEGHLARVERVDSIAADYGLGPVRTNWHLAQLMLRLGLLERVEDSGDVSWRPVTPLPLPEERIKLTEAEREQEDRIRWHGLHERNAQNLIRQFVDGDITTLTTTLRRLAERLDVTAEDAREAVLSLIEEGDFSASQDVTRIAVDELFDFSVDWKEFGQRRLSIRLVNPNE